MNKENLVEGIHYHGAIPCNLDLSRDYIYPKIGMATAPYDWSKTFDIEQVVANAIGKPDFKLPVKNQFQSYSCGGQATSYYKSVLFAIEQGYFNEKSAKFLYAPIAVSGGGSGLDALGQRCIKSGDSREDLCPSLTVDGTTNEQFMTNVSDISSDAIQDGKNDISKAYGQIIVGSIDDVANAAANNKGCVIGVYGSNNGTWLSSNPLPPTVSHGQCWAHWLYVGKVGMNNGKKAIGFINSWGNQIGLDGWQWITEDYFPNGIFQAFIITYPINLNIPYTPPVVNTTIPVDNTNWWTKYVSMMKRMGMWFTK